MHPASLLTPCTELRRSLSTSGSGSPKRSQARALICELIFLSGEHPCAVRDAAPARQLRHHHGRSLVIAGASVDLARQVRDQSRQRRACVGTGDPAGWTRLVALFAVSSCASLLAGGLYGLRRWRTPPQVQLAMVAAGLAIGCLPLLVAESPFEPGFGVPGDAGRVVIPCAMLPWAKAGRLAPPGTGRRWRRWPGPLLSRRTGPEAASAAASAGCRRRWRSQQSR